MLDTGRNAPKRKRASAEVGGETTEHNNGPPTDIVTVNGGDNGDNISKSSDTCSTISTTTGNCLYEAQKCHFGKTISLFMKRNMGRMPFCCDY